MGDRNVNLWTQIMDKGRMNGRVAASQKQRRTIDTMFQDAPTGWRRQVGYDLGDYPLYDALAMWVDGRDYLLKDGFIPRKTYDAIGELGQMYVGGKL